MITKKYRYVKPTRVFQKDEKKKPWGSFRKETLISSAQNADNQKALRQKFCYTSRSNIMLSGGAFRARKNRNHPLRPVHRQRRRPDPFSQGDTGFETHKKWALAGEDDSPIKWLQSLSDGDVALPVVVPQTVKSNYNARLPEGEIALLETTDVADLALLIVLSIPRRRRGT